MIGLQCRDCNFLLRVNGYCTMYSVGTAQSRQSAKRFSSRWNWDSPHPFSRRRVCPPPHPLVRGGGHTRLRLKGWGSPNSNEGTYTVVLYIYKYFVGDCNLKNTKPVAVLTNLFFAKIYFYFYFVAFFVHPLHPSSDEDRNWSCGHKPRRSVS